MAGLIRPFHESVLRHHKQHRHGLDLGGGVKPSRPDKPVQLHSHCDNNVIVIEGSSQLVSDLAVNAVPQARTMAIDEFRGRRSVAAAHAIQQSTSGRFDHRASPCRGRVIADDAGEHGLQHRGVECHAFDAPHM
jgi:hypothetical protein